MGTVAEEDGKGHGNEVQMVELSDGKVMLNARSQGKGTTKRRKIAISEDGGETWTRLGDDETLIGPVCQASILRFTWPENGKNRILFCNPATQKNRSNGKIRISYDDGKTWPDSIPVYEGEFAYSCMTRLSGSKVGVLFEKDGYRTISFASIELN